MKNLKSAFMITLIFILVCGLAYPLLMTGIGQLFFNHRANGSMIEVNGKVVGSELIGQKFTDDRFFRGRISAIDYNTSSKQEDRGNVNSGASNLAPSSKDLKDRVLKDIDDFLKKNPDVKRDNLPQDLFTSSASGLDPDISVEASKIQVKKISKTTGIDEGKLLDLINKNTEGKDFGVFSERRVNVLKLNLDVAKLLNLI